MSATTKVNPFTKRRTELLEQAQTILDGAKSADRDLTTEENATVEGILAQVDEVEAQREEARKSDDLMARIGALGASETKSGPRFLRLDGRAIAAKAMHTADGEPRDIKSLLAAGSTAVTAEDLPLVPMTSAATSILDVIPAQVLQRPPHFSYLRQNTRTNNAKFVVPGELKPTSVYQLERIEATLQVLAHLSEPIDEYWLKDNPNLGQFIQAELTYGLNVGLEAQVLNGDGVAPNLLGFANVSGIQTQSFIVDAVQTSRTALNKVELLGTTGQAFILHPNDWLAIETMRTTTNQYLLESAGAPIERATRRLWGVPVALSNALTPGTGWLLGDGAAELYYDRTIALQFGPSGDDFSRNQVRGRIEGRFQLAVHRPAFVVRMSLTGA